jgi:hypothetical protein
MGRYRTLRGEVERHRTARGRGARRGARAPAQAEPGRLAVVRRRAGPSLGLVCQVDPRRHRLVASVLLPQGQVVTVKGSHLKQVFWATPAIPVPRDWERRTASLRQALARHSLADLQARERAGSPEAALGEAECHRCPWSAQPRCDQAWRDLERMEARLAQRRESLAILQNAYWKEFCRVVEVLERFRAVEDGKLLPKGQLIAGFRHDNELLVAEMVDRGILEGLALPEAAAVCSCLIEEARSGDPAAARLFLAKRARLKRKVRDLETAADEVVREQRLRRIPMPVTVSTGFMPSVFRWASGEEDWGGIVEESFGGHEGDLIRAFRRLIDLLRQLSESPEVSAPLATLLGRAARVVDRGIVLESALI